MALVLGLVWARAGGREGQRGEEMTGSQPGAVDFRDRRDRGK